MWMLSAAIFLGLAKKKKNHVYKQQKVLMGHPAHFADLLRFNTVLNTMFVCSASFKVALYL